MKIEELERELPDFVNCRDNDVSCIFKAEISANFMMPTADIESFRTADYLPKIIQHELNRRLLDKIYTDAGYPNLKKFFKECRNRLFADDVWGALKIINELEEILDGMPADTPKNIYEEDV